MLSLPSLLLLSSPVVRADVAPPVPSGRKLISHQAHILGLDTHPGVVLLAYDAGNSIHAHRVFTAGLPRQEIAYGRARGAQLSAPHLWLMTEDAYSAWQSETSALILEQREACRRGEGCAHISRFTPSYPPPKDATDCGADIAVTTEVEADGPDSLIDTFTLLEGVAGRCVLSPVIRSNLADAPRPVLPPPPPMLPAKAADTAVVAAAPPPAEEPVPPAVPTAPESAAPESGVLRRMLLAIVAMTGALLAAAYLRPRGKG